MSYLWMVTSGEYSDYGVCAVFETEKDALAAVTLGVGERVEQVDYYRTDEVPVRRERWNAYSGRIDANGDVLYGDREASRSEPWVPSSRSTRPEVREEREGGFVWVHVEAATKATAEKVLSERVAKVRAELMGL